MGGTPYPRGHGLRVSPLGIEVASHIFGLKKVNLPTTCLSESPFSQPARLICARMAARKIYTVGRRKYKLVSGDGSVVEVNKIQTTIIGRIRWSFREH